MVHEKRTVEITVISGIVLVSVRAARGAGGPPLVVDALLHHIPGIQPHSHSVIEVAKTPSIPSPTQGIIVFTKLFSHPGCCETHIVGGKPKTIVALEPGPKNCPSTHPFQRPTAPLEIKEIGTVLSAKNLVRILIARYHRRVVLIVKFNIAHSDYPRHRLQCGFMRII